MQEQLAEKILENETHRLGKTKSDLLREVGYSREVIDQKPTKTIEAEGVKEALGKKLAGLPGFSTENARAVVSEILTNVDEKGDTRLRAADMVFKVLGDYAPERIQVNSANISLELVSKLDDLSLTKLMSESDLQSLPLENDSTKS